MYVRGMCGSVYLHIGRYQHIIPNLNAMVIHEGAVHIDYHFIAYKDILSIFAMEIDIYMNSFSHLPSISRSNSCFRPLSA